MTIDSWIRRGSLAILGSCVLVVALTLAGIARAADDESGATGYRVNELVDVPADWFRGRQNTLLVFLRSDCAASQAVAARLRAVRADLPINVQMVAVVSDASEREIAFAESAGFQRSETRTVDFHTLRLRVVPAVVLVDVVGSVKGESLATPRGVGEDETVAFRELSSLATGS
jgi:hypothetical protein